VLRPVGLFPVRSFGLLDLLLLPRLQYRLVRVDRLLLSSLEQQLQYLRTVRDRLLSLRFELRRRRLCQR